MSQEMQEQITSLKLRCFDLGEHANALTMQIEQANQAIVKIAQAMDMVPEEGEALNVDELIEAINNK